MSEIKLNGVTVAILATNGFEEAELLELRDALDKADPLEYGALLLPGGVLNAD
ncbi:MAG: hypothetical protein WA876_00325 [Candidatus Acidiferrales bacterium]